MSLTPISPLAAFLDHIAAQVGSMKHTPQSHFMHLPPGSKWKTLQFRSSFTVEWNGSTFALRLETQNRFANPENVRAVVFGRRLRSNTAKCPNTARATLTTDNFDPTFGYFFSPKLTQAQRDAVAPFFAYEDSLPYFNGGHFYTGTPVESAFLARFLTALYHIEKVKSPRAEMILPSEVS